MNINDSIKNSLFCQLPGPLLKCILVQSGFSQRLVCKKFKELFDSALKSFLYNSKDPSFTSKLIKIEKDHPQADVFQLFYKVFNLVSIDHFKSNGCKILRHPNAKEKQHSENLCDPVRDLCDKARRSFQNDNLFLFFPHVMKELESCNVFLACDLDINGVRIDLRRPLYAQVDRIDTRGMIKDADTTYLDKPLMAIPPEICHFANLRMLHILKQDLTHIAPEVFSLTNLTSLNLNENKIVEIPAAIGKLQNLTQLDCSHNKLCTVAIEINKLVNMTVVSLHNNELKAFPEGLFDCAALQRLELFHNQIQEIPSGIRRQKTLLSLKIGDNELQSLPDAMGNLHNLCLLDISANRVRDLPPSLLKGDSRKIELGGTRLGHLDYLEQINLDHQISQKLLPNDFSTFTQESAKARAFQGTSLLAQLHRATVLGNTLNRSSAINAFSENDRNLFYEMIWECSGSPQIDDHRKWGENNCLTVDKNTFKMAIEELIIAKYQRLNESVKKQVESNVWVLTGGSKISDNQGEWGKNYAMINLELLADAMDNT